MQQKITVFHRNYMMVLVLMGLFYTSLFSNNNPACNTTDLLKIVRGIVTDASGEPLVGATVTIKGGGYGTTTDYNGDFAMEVPENTTVLVVSYIGYISKTVEITEGTDMVIVLDEAGVSLNDVVVIGSRNQTRTKVESPVPVDIIPIAQVINEVGQVDLNQILTFLAPSFQSARQAISDGTDHVDPAQLRGLGPDQVLVLVNGKRRHQSALVNVNGTVNRGTVGTDLNAIPASAIERVEILRDGASAQYGSDAIAGVINIVLKKQPGVAANVSYGFNNTSYNKYYAAKRVLGAYQEINEKVPVNDGTTLRAALSGGAALGKNGYFNLMGEYVSRDRSNRSGLYTGQIWPNVNGVDQSDSINNTRGLSRDNFDMLIGNSKIQGGSVFYNTAYQLVSKVEVYSFGGYSTKEGNAAGFYRYPNSIPGAVRESVLAIYPFGFLPEINSTVNDLSIAAGIKTKLNGWNGDLSYIYGSNSFDFGVANSINYSQINSFSPVTAFDAGGLAFRQGTLNLDWSRQFNVLKGLNMAFGGEYRRERFAIRAGDEASYKNYEPTLGVAAGAQVFPGFLPTNVIDSTRSIGAVYADVEQDITSKFMVGVAGRLEHYPDFGSTLNGKLASRYKITNNLSIRASASTGFRAPSQQQKYFAKTSTVFLSQGGNLVPVEAGTFTNYSKPAELLGINPLQEETSVNMAAGIAAHLLPGLDFTLDVYQINIKNRIVLTNNFNGGSDLVLDSLLKANNAGTANFFANAVDTRSKGLEAVLSYAKRLNTNNELRASLAFTSIDNKVVTDVEGNVVVNASETLIRTGQLGKYFNREDQSRIEVASPKAKATFMVNYRYRKLNVMVRNTYFGQVTYIDPSIDPSKPDAFPVNAFTGKKETLDQTFSPKIITDFTIGYQLVPGFNLSAGVNNLFDIYPDIQTHSGNMSSGRFVYSRRVQQMGFNGRNVYLVMSYKL